MVQYPPGGHYEIKLPMLPLTGLRMAWAAEREAHGGVALPADIAAVTAHSPMAHRRAVERLGIFLKREEHFDFPVYDAEEAADLPRGQGVAYLWTTHHHAGWKDEPLYPAIGACCFRWRQWADAPEGWALAWVWFHPYERRQGHLTRAWPYFRERFGDFLVEPPLSPAMQAFMRKQQDDAVAVVGKG